MAIEYSGFWPKLVKNRLMQIVCLVGLAAPPTLMFWDTPIVSKSQFGGFLSSYDAVEFDTARRKGRTSPLCGCYADLPRENWSGISLVRRQLTAKFEHAQGERYAVIVSSTFPGPIDSQSSINLDIFITYKSGWNDGRLPSQWIEANNVQIITQEPLQLRPDETSPLASILPAPYTSTTVTPAERDSDELRVVSQRQPEPDLSPGYDFYFDFPAVDLLGQIVEIRPIGEITDLEIGVSPQHKEQFDFESFEIDRSQVESIFVRVPFAARVSFLGVTDSYEYARRSAPSMEFPENVESWIVSMPGRLSVSTASPVQEDEYEILSNKLDGERLVMREQSWTSPELMNASMNYRVPLAAPRRGYQIYGTMEELKIKGARGGLTIGAQDWPISAPSELRFIGIEPVVDDDDAVSTPLTVDRGSEGQLSFRAWSKIELNDVTVAASDLTLGRIIGILGIVIGIVLGVYQIIDLCKKSRKTE